MVIKAATTAGHAVRRQFGMQNIKNRLIRVAISETAILTAINEPPTEYHHWIAILGGLVGGWWTSAERALADVPSRRP